MPVWSLASVIIARYKTNFILLENAMSLTKEQISAHVNDVLSKLFELESEQLVPQANLYEDLDIDSIDTVDLLIELKKILGRDIDPQAFREARTLGDVVDIIASM